MADLKSPKVIWAKGGLFLILGLMSAGMLVAEMPSVRIVVLLGITVWAFCRAYYFAFYVIEHYVDPGYRFAGLFDFVRYVMRRRID